MAVVVAVLNSVARTVAVTPCELISSVTDTVMVVGMFILLRVIGLGKGFAM